MLLRALLMWKIWLLPHPLFVPWPLSVCMPLIFNYAAYFWALIFLPSFFFCFFFGNYLPNEAAKGHTGAFKGVNAEIILNKNYRKTSDKNKYEKRGH